jgi:hypothetical protein
VQSNIARGAPCPKGYLVDAPTIRRRRFQPGLALVGFLSPCGFLVYLYLMHQYLMFAGGYSMEFYHAFKRWKFKFKLSRSYGSDKEKLGCRGCCRFETEIANMLRKGAPTVASARVLMGKSCDLIMTSSFCYCSACSPIFIPAHPALDSIQLYL